jgi:tetratricopeptide (TPR) repeat protein
MNSPASHFIAGLEANLAFWQQQIAHYDDRRGQEFMREQANIILAVKMGLALPATRATAVELLLLAFPLVERSGFWDQWRQLLSSALAIGESFPAVVQARLNNRYGQLLRLMRLLKEAAAIHHKAEKIALLCKETVPIIEAEIWFNLSVDYRLLRHYDEAEKYGQQALDLFCRLPDCEKWQAAILNTLGLLALERARYPEAEEKLRHSLALWQRFNEPTEEARVLNGLALALHRQKQLEAALYYYRQALERLAMTASELDMAEVNSNLGALYFEWQEYDKAAFAFRQAQTVALHYSGNFRLRAIVAQNLGNVLLKQEQFAEAEGWLQKSRVLWQQMGDDLMLANTLGTLAELFAAMHQQHKAAQFYNEALSLLQRYPQNTWAKELMIEFNEGLERLK